MATPIQNAQFLAALQSPIQESLNRRNANLVTLALRNKEAERREQAALADARLRQRLAVMQEEGAMRRAELSNDSAMARLDAQADRDDARATAAMARADKKELQSLRESINAAHQAYIQAGGAEALESFGNLESADRAELLSMLSGLTDAAGKQAIQSEAAAVQSGLDSIGARSAALGQQLEADVSAYVDQVIANEVGFEFPESDFEETYAKLVAAGASPEGALDAMQDRYPREVVKIRNAAMQAKVERAASLRESRQFRDAFNALRDERELIMQSAAKPGVASELLRRRSAFIAPEANSVDAQPVAKTGSIEELAQSLSLDLGSDPAGQTGNEPTTFRKSGLVGVLKGFDKLPFAGAFQGPVPVTPSNPTGGLGLKVLRELGEGAKTNDKVASTMLAQVLFGEDSPTADAMAEKGLGARGVELLRDTWNQTNDRIRAENLRQSQLINATRERDRRYLNSIFGDPTEGEPGS